MRVVDAPHAAEAREWIREWRRGHAELSYRGVLSDAYISLFAVLMVGSMAGSLVLNLRRLADASCGGACEQARMLGPWMCALAVTALAMGAARLLGPVFSSPAANAWLLSTPVDRGALLRPGWLWTTVLTVVGSGVLLVVPATLGGFGFATAGVFVVAGTAASVSCVGLAALSQIYEHPAARWVTWLITGSLWTLLALAASDRLGWVHIESRVGLGLGLAATGLLGAFILTWRAVTALPTMSRRVLGHTEHLAPSLSGALSGMDLGLMYDVLLARRWSRSARVTSHTGGPLGWWALLHRDVRRALRSPQPYVMLAGTLLLPYAAAQADAGRSVVLATTLAGFVAGPPLCAGLRVVVRTQGLVRMLPLSGTAVRSAHVVVPGIALGAFGLATTGALLPAMSPGEAVVVALACGLSAFAATIRWVTAAPPDYAKPMISTPAGALPPGVMFSVFRGFDVWAVTALWLTFSGWGVIVSIAFSLLIVVYLVTKDPA